MTFSGMKKIINTETQKTICFDIQSVKSDGVKQCDNNKKTSRYTVHSVQV